MSKACATIVGGVLNFKTLRYIDTRYFIEYSNTFQQMLKIMKYRTLTFYTYYTCTFMLTLFKIYDMNDYINNMMCSCKRRINKTEFPFIIYKKTTLRHKKHT